MASAAPTEYNLDWLSGCIEAWILKSGGKKGFSLKENKDSRIYLSCPTSGEVYLELSEQGVSLWTDQEFLQGLIQNSPVLDLLESPTSKPLNPEHALEALAALTGEKQDMYQQEQPHELQLMQQDTDMDDPSGEDDQPDDNEGTDDDDFNEGDYYGPDDLIDEAPSEVVVKEKDKEAQDELSADQFFTGDGSFMAVQRLLLDLKNLNKIGTKYGFIGAPRGDNLFLWDVKLMDFEKGSKLSKDLQKWAKSNKKEECIYMEMKFPKDYPMSPPFVRVLRPKFQFLTGHITIGGSVCMQVLTRSGWQPTNDIESILVQIRAQICADPNASLNLLDNSEYSESEAKSAFERMCFRYGWKN